MRSTRGDWLIVTLWLGSLALVRAGTVQERDPYWQARAGAALLSGAPLRGPDTWSWEPVPHDVSWTSPAWNVVLGVAYQGFGFFGIFIVALVAIGLLLTSMVLIARRLGARPFPTLAAFIPILLMGLPFLSPRATVPALALSFFAVYAAHLWAARAEHIAALPGSVAVMVVASGVATTGMWLHLSWLGLGPLVAAACSVLWWLTPGLDRMRRAGFTVAASAGVFVGILLGPYGLEAVAQTRAVQEACADLITEWFGMFHPFMVARWGAVGVLALVGACWSALWCVNRWRSGQLGPRESLTGGLSTIALPAALGGFVAVRFIGVVAYALAPVIAFAATALADRAARRAAEDPPHGVFRSARLRFWSQGRHWRPVLVIAWAVLLPGVLLLTHPFARPVDEAGVLSRLPSGCRLVSDAGSGGAAVLLRPDLPVWYDGRADYWGHQRNALAAKVLASDRVDVPPFTHAGCVVLRVDGAGAGALRDALDTSESWARVARSGPVIGWVRVEGKSGQAST